MGGLHPKILHPPMGYGKEAKLQIASETCEELCPTAGALCSREDHAALLKAQRARVGEPSTTHAFCHFSLQAEKSCP